MHPSTVPHSAPAMAAPPRLALLLGAGVLALAFSPEAAARGGQNFCSSTAKTLSAACLHDVEDDAQVTRANCINIEDGAERADCEEEAAEARNEGRSLCRAQFRARRDVCGDVGEARYDPSFEPADFVDPLQIGGSVPANPYFPLDQGRSWVYEGGDEQVTVTVTDRVKLIEGVSCLVVTDVVEEDGQPIEVTEDWFAQDAAGNIWYCGELSQSFELQDDGEAELVNLDGSFKTGREFAKPGIIIPANPAPGQVYRQEFALGEAEDVAEILDTAGSETTPAATCNGDCLVTKEFTPIEPDVFETKYYAPGVGFILEVDPETGERLELIELTAP